MKPKGWRLDPAWVEHYSKIKQERTEREIERIKRAHELEIQRIQNHVASFVPGGKPGLSSLGYWVKMPDIEIGSKWPQDRSGWPNGEELR